MLRVAGTDCLRYEKHSKASTAPCGSHCSARIGEECGVPTTRRTTRLARVTRPLLECRRQFGRHTVLRVQGFDVRGATPAVADELRSERVSRRLTGPTVAV